MTSHQLNFELEELKGKVIQSIRDYLGSAKLVQAEQPEVDYRDSDSLRIVGISGEVIYIHPNDGDNYEIIWAEISDLLHILHLLESDTFSDFDFHMV